MVFTCVLLYCSALFVRRNRKTDAASDALSYKGNYFSANGSGNTRLKTAELRSAYEEA